MSALKIRDLREKTIAELEEAVAKERASLYDVRRKLSFREIKDTNAVKTHRHNIARLLTLITEKRSKA
jgi:large subunit ribosomal protein L29